MTQGSVTSAPPLDNAGFLRWMWRQLTSMRVALILLFALAVAAIPGSILPQRGTNPIKVDEWIADAPTWGPILDALGFFDVYAAPWFAAIYLLLFISLIGCVLPRIGEHWKAMRKPPPAAPRNLDRFAGTISWESSDSVENVLATAASGLRKRRWRIQVSDQSAQEGWIAAERGYLKETGNLIFHISLIGILIGVAVGGLFGWRGNVIIREGSGFSNTLTQYDAWGGGRLANADELQPFSYTLEDFRVEFDRAEGQRGSPRLFEAELTYRSDVSDPGEPITIRVNEPLVASGAKVFLVGHGYAPHFIVRDADGNVVFDDSVPFLPQDGNFTSTGVIKVPDTSPQVAFTGIFLPTTALDEVRGPHSVFPDADDPSVFLSGWQGDLGLDSGIPRSVYSLDTDGLEQIGLEALLPGQTWQFENGSIEFAGWERWASFQIANDPGKELALIAGVIAMTGLMFSLFIKRRRVWVKVARQDSGVTLVHVAGLAREEGGSADEVIAETARMLGAPDIPEKEEW